LFLLCPVREGYFVFSVESRVASNDFAAASGVAVPDAIEEKNWLIAFVLSMVAQFADDGVDFEFWAAVKKAF